MSLSRLALQSGGIVPKTHEDRLMVLTALSPDDDVNHLKALVKTGNVAWMETLVDIGTFDLGTALQDCILVGHAQKVTFHWADVSKAFLDFFGAGDCWLRKESDRIEAHDVAVFRRDAEVLALFDRTTFRLAAQAPAIRNLAASSDPDTMSVSNFGLTFSPFAPLDSIFARESFAVEALALWASVACALNRPEALKALIDAFPEAMTTAVPSQSKLWEGTLKNMVPVDFYGTNVLDDQRVSPFFFALHASSRACVKVILDKRESMGLTLDAPLAMDKGARKKEPKSFLDAIAFSDPCFMPEVVVEAIDRVLKTQPAEAAHALAWNLVKRVDLHPNLFALTIPLGIYHASSKALRLGALQAAVIGVPKAMPDILARIDWDELAPAFVTRESPMMKATTRSNPSVKPHREAALLALIQKAQVDGREDVVFQTYGIEFKDKGRVPAPLTLLSVAGYEKTVLAFLDHGYDPRTKSNDSDHSLLDVAKANNHPTLGLLLSHMARGQAQKLLMELGETEAHTPKP